ncbi:uncharacterized protein EpC_15380 [Erwinia pyrifoliae Ep1/96]|nr:uncharacterized protein EpC_15380 [Erwinia pyrifoliae Ep1/96]
MPPRCCDMAKLFCRLSAPGRTGRQTGMLMLFKRLKADFTFSDRGLLSVLRSTRYGGRPQLSG